MMSRSPEECEGERIRVYCSEGLMKIALPQTYKYANCPPVSKHHIKYLIYWSWE